MTPDTGVIVNEAPESNVAVIPLVPIINTKTAETFLSKNPA